MSRNFLPIALILMFIASNWLCADNSLRVGTFAIDASPPIGSPLAYDPTQQITEPLSCRGIVILTDEAPIVLCAIDWLGVANDANLAFRESLAAAVETSSDRVVMHSLHQHDAPRCDLSAAKILEEGGHAAEHFDVKFIRDVIRRASEAAKVAVSQAKPIAAISFGKGIVDEVASNRRMLGPDGVVHTTRYTACKDPAIAGLPVGVIDPELRILTFDGATGPVAALTFYATHPQSYYRTGGANPDFPGMARNAREKQTGVFHLHFNGAGGNIGAGKYNDGSTKNRQVLADRVTEGMQRAWDARQPLDAEGIEPAWNQYVASLPVGQHLHAATLQNLVADEATPFATRCNAAEMLAFLRRADSNGRVDMPISRLRLGTNELLFMPGELFVEYQLAAQAMKPEANVLVAAYGDYGTAYIGTRVAYSQGGYEVSERATNVAPDVETELVEAMSKLLEPSVPHVLPSDFTARTGLLPKLTP